MGATLGHLIMTVSRLYIRQGLIFQRPAVESMDSILCKFNWQRQRFFLASPQYPNTYYALSNCAWFSKVIPGPDVAILHRIPRCPISTRIVGALRTTEYGTGILGIACPHKMFTLRIRFWCFFLPRETDDRCSTALPLLVASVRRWVVR